MDKFLRASLRWFELATPFRVLSRDRRLATSRLDIAIRRHWQQLDPDLHGAEDH
jgi:hypothetical protein